MIASTWQTISMQNKQKKLFHHNFMYIANKLLIIQCHLFPPNNEMQNKAVILLQTLLAQTLNLLFKGSLTKPLFLDQLVSKQISLSHSRQHILTPEFSNSHPGQSVSSSSSPSLLTQLYPRPPVPKRVSNQNSHL